MLPRLGRLLRRQAEQLAGAFRLELAGADRWRRLSPALPAPQSVVAGFRRQAELDVLPRRQPYEVGMRRARQKVAFAGRCALRSAEREQCRADFCKEGGFGAHVRSSWWTCALGERQNFESKCL